MNIKLAKDIILENEETHQIFEGMDEDEIDALLSHFFNYPTPFSFTRVKDNAEIKMTVKNFIFSLSREKEGIDNLIEFFFDWKRYFDRSFEKKVLDTVLPKNPKQNEYLFLRSSVFLKNREAWEKEKDINKFDIFQSYRAFKEELRSKRSLGEYYVIMINDPIILANKKTKQLYHLIKTSGFIGGKGFSLVPLMISYEEEYKEISIEEHEVWDGKFETLMEIIKRGHGYSVSFFYFI